MNFPFGTGKCVTLPAVCITKNAFPSYRGYFFVYLCSTMRYIIIFSALFLAHADMIMSQEPLSYDTIINREWYQSYFNQAHSTVSFVRYQLYKGGGSVSRKGMTWVHSVGDRVFPYAHSGYDKGHLAPAQDFAWSRAAMLSTFDYCNALPQAPALNRGAWKKLETKVRSWSQSDTLSIECGGLSFDFKSKMVPKYFYKIVTRHQGRDTLVNIIYLNK